MRKLLFMDQETCGLHGFPVLIQYAYDDGPITLHEVWERPVIETLELIEEFTRSAFVGFNNAFDWFHSCKCYTVLSEYVNRFPRLGHFAPQIDLVVECEEAGMDGPCLKPAASCDLMLWSRKIPRYQTLMNRGDIRIRKVPTDLACVLADELDSRIELPEIYWARQKDKTVRWRIYDIEEQPHFKDLVLKFNASAGLKYLAEFALGEKPPFHFGDIACEVYPQELGYAPTARAAREFYGPEAQCWPDVIEQHIRHWHSNENARQYAWLDVDYTRKLYHAFAQEMGHDLIGDDDSELACMVSAVRWHGYSVDLDGIKDLRQQAQAVVDSAPINVNAPKQVREYLMEAMDPMESVLISESTRKQLLEEIAAWDDNEDAATRAKTILDTRKMQKEVELYDKLLLARRLHADLNIIGAMSSRMSGSSGLNVQGIKAEKKVRKCFPLKWDGMELCGGDFDAFEITLADCVYDDPDIRNALRSGQKLHGHFGTLIYPGKTYAEILASEGTDFDMYTRAKSAVFALLYGGTAFTLHTNLAIPIDIAEAAIVGWYKLFPGIGKAIARITEQFSAIVQNGPGFSWVGADDYVETKMGFKRSFELENTVMKTLFDLAQSPPKEWDKKKIKVVRRQKIQTAGGAVRSALYGAAFSIQNSNIRAATNHEVQSLGATVCKRVQRKAWDVQPAGVHPWRVAPLNVHDELQAATAPEAVDELTDAIVDAVESLRSMVPLLGLKWSKNNNNWAEKKSGDGNVVHIKPPPLVAS